MQALHDPTKKTSINSLLNPQDTSSFPVPLTPISPGADANQGNPHGQSSIPYGQLYPQSDNVFSLRTATWDDSDPRPSSSSTIQGHPRYHAYYHHQQPQAPSQISNGFAEYHGPGSLMRSDRPDDRYLENGHRWPHVQHNSYNGAIQPSYSDERNAPSCEYRCQQHPPSNGQEHPMSSNAQIWQQSERASVRLAAREIASASAQVSSYPPSPPFSRQPNDLPPLPSQEPYPQQQSQQGPKASVSPTPQTNNGPATTSSSKNNKRPHPEPDAAPAPKAKKTKEKRKSTSSGTQESSSTIPTSRRGYNAKKRQEVASITAQNATAYQNIQKPGKPGLSATLIAENGGHVLLTLIPELQFARCMSHRYKNEEFTRCVSCTRRWAGDTCRFQGIRYLMRDETMNLRGISFAHKTDAEASKMKFPTKWNREFEREHVRRLKLSIAKALLPTLTIEQQHMQATELIRRPRETDVRATCDTCMTSLFSTSFMCRLCGREACNECFQTVRDLTCGEVAVSELAAVTRERQAHANPFFLSCLKRAEHGYRDFTPVTRFVQDELNGAIAEMRSILEKDAKEVGPETEAEGDDDASRITLSYDDVVKDRTAPFPDPLASPIFDNFTPTNVPEHVISIPIRRVQIIPASYYDPPPADSPSATQHSFASIWKRGLPLLVKDVLPRFKLDWSPEYFLEKYGDQSCIIVECQTDTNKKLSVKEFFSYFGKYQDRKECWKLKDWPPTAEFKGAFPELFEDFSSAVPVQDYVRRDGVYNIGSHFPANALGPDLGPKMYNAMASSQEAGSKGSTRLHMDMADAFNVMLNATDCEDGTPGYAVWDLFRAEDSDRIRAFLRKKFAPGSTPTTTNGGGGGSQQQQQQQQQPTQAEKAAALHLQAIAVHDPIHSQHFYLDVELRRQLWEEYGVKSFRIYQRPGEGIFIPAGCAHQVANMADCMKVAIDFVSPENIDRCERLTKEFREQNHRKAWKEDVLQLRTMMWFAWQSCSIREAEMNEDLTSLGGQVAVVNGTVAREGSDEGGAQTLAEANT